MIRVVLDTNIIISGRLWSGAPHQVMQAARNGKFRPLTSEILLEELRDVLQRPKFKARLEKIARTAEQIVEEYLQLAEVVTPALIPPVVLEDPDDDEVIACAVGGKASGIVTGDVHLLALGAYETLLIWDAPQFLAYLSEQS